jgi:hypothetical protein
MTELLTEGLGYSRLQGLAAAICCFFKRQRKDSNDAQAAQKTLNGII